MSTTTTRPIALILGSGPNIGTSLLSTLTSHNYLIVTASRSSPTSTTPATTLSLTADFSNPSSIPPLFTAVKEKFGRAPSVVIYNAAALTPPPVDGNVLSVDGEAFGKDLNVNTVSAYVAGVEAVKAWEAEAEREKGEEKTFIYTGNALNQNVMPVPAFLTLGVGKSASAYWVGLADQVYRGRGYRYFYADQRQEDGAPMGTAVDGPAHAEFYAKLARREAGEVPWLATFVKGKGYVKF